MLPWWLAAVGIPVGAAVILLALRLAGRREPDPETSSDDRRPEPEPGARTPEAGHR